MQASETQDKIDALVARFREACRDFVTNKSWGEVTISLPFKDGAADTQRFTKVETFR